MSSANKLFERGLTNRNTPDLGEFINAPMRDKRGTWCSSFTCQGSRQLGARGLLVWVGNDYRWICPRCKSEKFLFHDTVTPSTAEKFQRARAK